MKFTCDSCRNDYRAAQANAAAFLYVKDDRCNHLQTTCTHCGAPEVIYLGPQRLAGVIAEGALRVTVHAEAGQDLRARAERAWAAAQQSPRPVSEPEEPQTATVPSYELLPRHEELLDSFAATLAAIPEALLWDELSTDHERSLPERWVD